MEVCPAFIDETGVLTSSSREQPVYGIGLLVVHDPVAITDALYKTHFGFISERATRRRELIEDIRDRGERPQLDELNKLLWSTRHHEYKFTEVSDHNIQDYVDLLNVYFSFAALEFHSLIIDRSEPNFSFKDWGADPWAAYVNIGRELLKRRLKRDVFAIVDLQGKPDKSDYRLEDVFCSLAHVKGCIRATSEMSVFLQLTDVLLGCVQFDWKDQHGYYGTDSRRAEATRQLAAFIKARLGLRKEEWILTQDRNYRQRSDHPVFSAWRMVYK